MMKMTTLMTITPVTKTRAKTERTNNAVSSRPAHPR